MVSVQVITEVSLDSFVGDDGYRSSISLPLSVAVVIVVVLQVLVAVLLLERLP